MAGNDAIGMKEKLTVEKYVWEQEIPRWFGVMLDDFRAMATQLDNIEWETKGLKEKLKLLDEVENLDYRVLVIERQIEKLLKGQELIMIALEKMK